MRRGLALLALVGCAGAPSPEARLLALVPADVAAVVAIAPAGVRGTWLDRSAAVYAAALPACVRDRARAAAAVVVGWRPDGWLLLLAGGGVAAPGCAALAGVGEVAWLRAGQPPRVGDAPGFFAGDERRRRWRALGTVAPVRALADLTVSSGIAARVGARLDPRDGVDGRATVALDDRAAALGGLDRLTRWRGGLDRDRLGGAWPLVAAVQARVDGRAVIATVRLAGGGGGDAAALAIAALLGGAGDPAAACPTIPAAWGGQVRCAAPGRFVVAAALRDALLVEPGPLLRGGRVVPALAAGVPQGLRLAAVHPTGLLAALGLDPGDVVRSVAGVALGAPGGLGAVAAAVRGQGTVELVLDRRGARVTLTYQVR